MLKLLTITFVAVVLTACSKNKEALLVSVDFKTRLRYDCGNIQSQAKTMEDVALLFSYAANMAEDSLAKGDVVSAQELAVTATRDIRALEKYVAAYEANESLNE